jgi:hypothetical protein
VEPPNPQIDTEIIVMDPPKMISKLPEEPKKPPKRKRTTKQEARENVPNHASSNIMSPVPLSPNSASPNISFSPIQKVYISTFIKPPERLWIFYSVFFSFMSLFPCLVSTNYSYDDHSINNFTRIDRLILFRLTHLNIFLPLSTSQALLSMKFRLKFLVK